MSRISAEPGAEPSEPSLEAPAFAGVTGWRRVVLRVAHAVEPEGQAAEAIYGTLIAAAVLATAAGTESSSLGIVWSALIVLGLYWFAHVYADIVGERLRTRSRPGWRHLLSHALRDWSMLRGALIPVIIFAVVRLAGASINSSVLTALWSTVFLLACWGLVAALRGGARGLELLLETVVCALFGVLVVVLKIYIH